MIGLLQEWIGDSNNDELARLIIEVIIQKDDPKQHRAIINYLFDRLQTQSDNQRLDNRTDIFMIIVDLYSHNMLQPKFHIRYNSTILFYPRYVEIANNFRHRRYLEIEEKDVKYDSNVLADMFCEETLSNNKFREIIDALYYLDNEFNHNVVERLKEESVANISELFSVIRNMHVGNIKKSLQRSKNKKNEMLMQYFLEAGLQDVLEIPQVYVSIINLIILNKYDIDISIFFKYNFETNRLFYYYSIPEALLALVYEAINNKEKFLLLLILLIHCCMKGTNIIIGYLLDIGDRIKDREEVDKDKVIEFTYWIWKSFNENEDFDVFKKIVEERNLYIHEQDNIYKKLFVEYREGEMEINDHRITEYIKHNKN